MFANAFRGTFVFFSMHRPMLKKHLPPLFQFSLVAEYLVTQVFSYNYTGE